jgi:hypothetical protein
MQQLNRLFRGACCAAVLSACSKSDKSTAADSSAAMSPAAPSSTAAAATPKAISLADVAGTWNMRSVPTTGRDTSPTNYKMTANADGTAKIEFANGLKVTGKAAASGDSIVTDAGPYASVRRKGMQVTTHGVLRRQGDKLVGTTIAHYKTTKADSVLTLRTEGTKAP